YCNPDESSCTETIVEKKPGDCYVFKKCASECQDFEYGEGCEKRCDNCQDSCDKFTGACNLCVPGFMNPKGGCLE
ncbi:cell death abnormality protein 1, partial [Biomphalaria glabrata]